jgi:hypothetical protein
MSFGLVEDSVRQIIVEIMNKIIKEENLPFERADAQIEIIDNNKQRKYPDIVIWKKGGFLRNGAILIELKQPKYVPFSPELVDEAFLKASKVNIPFFATCNMQELILFDAFDNANLMERRKGIYKISSIKNLNEIAEKERQKEFEEGLRKFLLNFTEIFLGNKIIPTIPVDEFFIYNLRSLVDALSPPLTEKIMEVFNNDANFRRRFQEWFVEQGWNPPLNTEKYYDEFNKSARQYLYLLANKLMFYLVLKTHIPSLPDLNVENANDGENLRLTLQEYFNKSKSMSGDYETIFGMNFIEEFPIPGEIVDSLKIFIRGLSKYDFKRIGYADLGKIFDKLIPEEERHKLGQYFTSQKHRDGTYWPDVVDLIIGFTIKKPDALVLDGAVGAGTFLVRSYARMKFLNPNLKHNDIISRLFGIDISKFPALLSAINLAVRDLSIKENYPIIINKDFFDISPSTDKNILDKLLDIKQRLLLLTQKETLEQSIPHVDAFIGNPPYTRQEEMEEYIKGYKEKLAKRIKNDWSIEIGARSSIYVYFMLHGIKFLKEGGRIGYITSNSWLDVDYGKYLQEFLLKNTKIIAIIESKAERWFEDADINTAITIAEKCSCSEEKEQNNKKEERCEKERNNNIVKFVQLKKRLEDIIPTTNENERWKAIDELTKLIETTNKYYEDERIRIFTKTQKELWEEGYDEEKGEYAGSKWGKYIRAPEIFFKILERGKDIFVPLKKIAEVRRGFTTGANEFFYLTQDEINKLGIEREFWMHPLKRGEEAPVPEHVWKDRGGEYFKASQYSERMRLEDVLRDDGYVYWAPNYVIKSTKECRSILIDPKSLKYRVLLIHKDKSELKGTNVLKYIEWGESRGFHLRPTCASRERWYDLGTRKPVNILFLRATEDRPAVYFSEEGLIHDQTFYSIYVRANDKKFIAAILNSTLINYFFREIISGAGIALGEGALWSAVYEVMNFPVLNPEKISKSQMKKLEEIFNKLSTCQINSIFKEIGATRSEEVSLDKVKPDRRELDKIIMGEILGLSEEEQLEVYRAVIDLVKTRIEKAKSTKKKKSETFDIESLAEDVLKEVGLTPLPEFPDLDATEIKEIKQIPQGTDIKIESTLFDVWLKIDGESIKCSDLDEANYLYWAAIHGKKEVPIPKNKETIRRIINMQEKAFKERMEKLDAWLEKNIPNLKDRKQIKEIITRKIQKPQT